MLHLNWLVSLRTRCASFKKCDKLLQAQSKADRSITNVGPKSFNEHNTYVNVQTSSVNQSAILILVGTLNYATEIILDI